MVEGRRYVTEGWRKIVVGSRRIKERWMDRYKTKIDTNIVS